MLRYSCEWFNDCYVLEILFTGKFFIMISSLEAFCFNCLLTKVLLDCIEQDDNSEIDFTTNWYEINNSV